MADDDYVDISEKIDILSMDDSKIKQVGELLSNDASRKILKSLFKNSLSAGELAKEADISLPLVMYHLKKMQDAKMVRVTNVGKTVESKDTKRYTTTKFAFVIVADSVKAKAQESKSIKRSFSGLYKFASIGVVTGAAWFASLFAQQRDEAAIIPSDEFARTVPEEFAQEESVSAGVAEDAVEAPAAEFETGEVTEPNIAEPAISEPAYYDVPPEVTEILPVDILWSTVIALGVLAVGLIIERAVRARRK